MILSAMCLLPLGTAFAGPDCKTKCAEKAATVATKGECSKGHCDKSATVVKKESCDKGHCDKSATVVKKENCDKAMTVASNCNLNCEKSVAKLFTSFDKDKDGKLDKAEFMTLVKAMTAKKSADKASKETAAN